MTIQRLMAEVQRIEPVAKATFRLDLRAEPIASQAIPGQFVMVGPLSDHGSDPFLNRPISIAGVGSGGMLELIVGVVGRGTDMLSRLMPGQRIGLLGPQGHGFSAPVSGGRSILVAGGLGIAPLRFLALRAADRGARVTLLYGVGTAKRFVRLDELSERGIEIRRATDDGSAGTRGLVTEVLEETLVREASARLPTMIAACGPMPMMRTTASLGARFGVPVEVSLESHMACGVGACLGCAIDLPGGTQRTCIDGPVFLANEVFP